MLDVSAQDLEEADPRLLTVAASLLMIGSVLSSSLLASVLLGIVAIASSFVAWLNASRPE